ncbi:MAG: Collagen alpha-5(VI) chain [Frankiales bacterium]|nr:Collagen alpha-5(VI) chain [Frankiales bacterium]
MTLTRKTAAAAVSIATAGAMVLTGASLAVASYSGTRDGGMILACWKTSAGANLRLVDHFPCKGNETPISWNRQGAKGEQGVAGVAGAPGASGSKGLTGAPGTDGSAGAIGRAGKDGLAGAAGKDGLAGLAGAAGKDGLAGLAGAAGKDGLAGAAGKDGVDGAAGKNGVDGAAGKDGLAGAAGKDGLDGAAGKDGSVLPDITCPAQQVLTGVKAGKLVCGIAATATYTLSLTTTVKPDPDFGQILLLDLEATGAPGDKLLATLPGGSTWMVTLDGDGQYSGTQRWTCFAAGNPSGTTAILSDLVMTPDPRMPGMQFPSAGTQRASTTGVVLHC